TDSSRVEEYSVFDFLTILPTSPQVRICGAPSLCYCSAIESMCYKIISKKRYLNSTNAESRAPEASMCVVTGCMSVLTSNSVIQR
uniref:Uncharacterized protein n=1 Tax=Magallana gigas TaxID=29159 RepID=A0A8W8IWX2_MAGGI